MFKRTQPQTFEITEHPDVIKALDVMWQQAYEAGKADALALVEDWLAEVRDRNRTADDEDALSDEYLDGIEDAVKTIEQG